ncbi:MAG: nickel-dependent hydrogenase large subunit [Candidatus Paceibacterota bacterium]|jgi:coenzyme F420-reducing hydrogenase alpha subunit
MFNLKYKLMHEGHHHHLEDFGTGGAEAEPAEMIIDITAVPRTEGDVKVHFSVKDNKVEGAVGPTEAPRIMEKVMVGDHYNEAPIHASKFCGICWVPHFEASAQAVENALGIRPTIQTQLFREVLAQATVLQSNVQHATLLSLPDLLRLPNAFSLATSHPAVFAIVRKLEKLGNDLVKVISGRNVGGVVLTVGGMLAVPNEKEVRDLLARVIDAQKDMATLGEVYGSFLTPDRLLPFAREREYISLSPFDGKNEYPYTRGNYCSSDTGAVPITVENYKSHTNEWFPKASTGKFTKHVRNSVTVGALARMNNNWNHIGPEAQALAKAYGITMPDYRIAMNPPAQVVEAYASMFELEALLETILFHGIKYEALPIVGDLGEKIREGVGIVEAPRGLLIHHYTLQGAYLIHANCVVPTGQNYGSMQDDIIFILPEYIRMGLSKEEIIFRLEKIVRDHDPCSSCAVHFILLLLKILKGK